MITPNCHECLFDWWHQDGIKNIDTRGHCIIYKINPNRSDRCWQMTERPKMINPTDTMKDVMRQDEIQIESNQRRYNNDPELKAIADKIHIDRMGEGKACSICICQAIVLLAAKKSVPENRE